MRRKNQRMVAPQASAQCCCLGETRMIGCGTVPRSNRRTRSLVPTFLITLVAVTAIAAPTSRSVQAADATGITLDNFTTDTLGDDTALTPNASNTFTITEAMGRRPLADASDPNSAAPNLFHSFFDFGLSAEQTALFTQAITDGSDPISNVISRVTGGMPSMIDGKISSIIDGADFWFINPAGLVFGEASSIDVSGSFNASAGDFIVLADGSTFSALSNDPVLTVNNPADFGFLTPDSGGTLSLNGVQLSGDRSSATPDRLRGLYLHGRDVNVDADSSILSDANSPLRGGIRLHANQDLTLSGDLATTTRSARRAGNVLLSGNNISIADADINSISTGRGRTGRIDFSAANDITLSATRTEISTAEANGGAARELTLNAGNNITTTDTALVGLTDSDRIDTDNTGTVLKPNIILNAGGTILMERSTALSTTAGEAPGGSVELTATHIRAVSDLSVQRRNDPTAGIGRALNSSSLGLSADAGDAGNIVLNAETIALEDGARATAISAGGGDAGDVLITASDSFTTNLGQPTGSDQVFISSANQGSSSANNNDRGASGDVIIQAGKLIDLNNTRLNAQRRSNRAETNATPSKISVSVPEGTLRTNRVNALSSTRSSNDAGVVEFIGADVELTRSTLSSFSTSTGNSGAVVVNGRDSVTGDRLRAEVEVNSGNRGAAGDISITSQGDINLTDSEIVAASLTNRVNTDANGNEIRSNITISTQGDITLTDSAVVASTLAKAAAGDVTISGDTVSISGAKEAFARFATGGARPSLGTGIEVSTKLQDADGGNAGDISITANNLNLRNGALLLSTTDGTGDAGDIQIDVAENLVSNAGVSYNADNFEDTLVRISSANLSVGDSDRKPSLGASGNVSITAGSLIDIANTEVFALRRSSNPDNTTPSQIDITVADGDIIAKDFTVSSSTRGDNHAGSVTLTADNLNLTNGFITSFTTGRGDSGSLLLDANNNIIIDNSRLIAQSGNTTKGAAGSIDVIAGGSVTVAQSELVASSQSNRVINDSNGNEIKPNVNVNASGDVSITDTAVLASTVGKAAAGGIQISGDTVSISGSRDVTSEFGQRDFLGSGISASTLGKIEDAGNAGSVSITAHNLELDNGARISSNTAGSGNAGDVVLTIADRFRTNGNTEVNADNQLATQVVVASTNLDAPASEQATMGASGNVTVVSGNGINLNNVQITAQRRSSNPDNTEASQLVVSVTDGDLVARRAIFSSSTLGDNNAGSARLRANNIDLTNSRLTSFTRGRGNSGSLDLTASDSITLVRTEVLVQSSNTGKGAAGSVALTAGGDISVNDTSIVASTASNRRIRDADGNQIRPNVSITSDTNISLVDSAVLASTIGRAAAGSIDITGDTVSIDGAKQVFSLFADMADLGTGVSASTLSDIDVANAGDAGNVSVTANSLVLANGAQITSTSSGTGDAGNINLIVAERIATNSGVEVTNANREDTQVIISSANLPVAQAADKRLLGASGNVSIEAGNAIDLNNTQITAVRRSSNPDNTNSSIVDVRVTNGDLVSTDALISSSTRGDNDGGSLAVSANNITMTGGELTSFTTGGGNSGSVVVDAANDLSLSKVDVLAQSGNTTKGAAGSVELRAGNSISVRDSAVVASTQSNRVIRDNTGEELKPNVTVASPGDVDIQNSAILASTTGRAAAGSINISAANLNVSGSKDVTSTFGRRPELGSGISASTLGADSRAGNAGNVTITADTIEFATGAQITSTTDGPGDAGDIVITATDTLTTNTGIDIAGANEGSTKVRISSANLIVDSPDEKPFLGSSGTVVVTAENLINANNTEISALRRSSNPDNVVPSTVVITVNNGDLIADNLIVSSATRGANNGGSVQTTANNIDLKNSQMLSFTTGEGNSGSVLINARHDITSDSTLYGVESGNTSKGAAGEIEIKSGGSITLTNSRVVAATQSNRRITDENGQQRVPRVTIESTGAVSLTDSAVLTSTVGEADAGSIDISGVSISVSGTREVVSQFGAKPTLGSGISASTLGDQDNAGHAGDVTLTATNIELSNGASITSRTGGTGNAGDIVIDAESQLISNRGLVVDEENKSSTQVLISSANLGADSPEQKFILGASGNVSVTAGELIDLTNTEITALRRSSNPENPDPSQVSITVENGDLIGNDIEFSSATRGENNGGSLLVSANNMELQGGVITAFTTGRGNGGSVFIDAIGSITASDLALEVESSNGSKGAAGLIDVRTGGELTLTDSRVVAATQSNRRLLDENNNERKPSVSIASGGAVRITDSAILASALGNAPAGNIEITAPDITVTGSREVFSRLRRQIRLGSGLSASANAGGEAGTIKLIASNTVTLNGASVSSQSLGEGTAGEIELAANNIVIGSGSEILASTQGIANGGKVTINAAVVEVAGATTRISSNSTSKGVGGEVVINVDNLSLSDGARIETLAEGEGPSGSITINAAGDVILDTADAADFAAQSALISESSISQGGSITANVAGELRVSNSRIESSVNEEDGQGGDINIAPQALLLRSGQILAQAQQGSGGAINIGRGGDTPPTPTGAADNGLFLIDSNSIINADSDAGTDGIIAVDSPDIGANAVIPQQNARIVSTPKLADSLCSAGAATRSSLVLVNEGGVPPAPDGYLSARLGLSDEPVNKTLHTPQPILSLQTSSALAPSAGCLPGGE